MSRTSQSHRNRGVRNSSISSVKHYQEILVVAERIEKKVFAALIIAALVIFAFRTPASPATPRGFLAKVLRIAGWVVFAEEGPNDDMNHAEGVVSVHDIEKESALTHAKGIVDHSAGW